MLLQKAVEKFRFHCIYEKNLSSKTIRAYDIDINQFLEKFVNYKINQINKFDLKDYVENLFINSYKIKTIKRKIAVLKAFFNYLEFDEIVEVNPFRKLKLSLKEPKLLPKTLELSEIKRVLKYLYSLKNSYFDKTSFSYKLLIRDIVSIEILFSTGIRVSELSNLKKNEINIKQGIVKIFGKGSKERIIQICDKEVLNLLKEYSILFNLNSNPNNHFLLNRLNNNFSEQSIRAMIHKYEQKLGLRQITPHMFRHSFATLLLEEGVDVRYIQNMLGHSSISTTQIYTKVNTKHQRKLLSSKHPRRTFSLSL
ncbi:tyrosine-type recombinase/integrase [Aliarcobacter butzleri]|uniref:Tyrosine-type recombinase/integrase n=1 Tax=Aliarcobacter butzleri TaxID=28197 RepID=A0AAW7PVA0_9BACT|nr:tyrosine-type recombinase/integrase [Aliarcobacter butzleri]MCT7538218.1 tyrosine-type recombinase/integrase [Aliarcobacter butzleri]MCT7588177.1 tyrosine-type recombinase/integrase [Aliarcobacter butzleri]MCT7624915.1 tyrosine-type recombinase/integrase [Aliarcobacter butzleri]MDN5064835.1 tyrosine-type recombinase/integrase [Aliarcobacter butzleri]MDN5066735.1 tyrosine-type recombinase/integrase [Aliarcobacter butzleri]